MGVFADCALSLREAGWAVMPAKGKTPKVAGFNKWSCAPGLKGIEKWATSGPDDDIVALTGLCRPRPDETGVVIVDPDDERAKDVAEDLFGYTPSRVLTRRGWHDGFRLPDGLDINKLPTSLRKYGVDLDLKYGRATGIIAMPMSVHEKDHSVCYRWVPGSGPFAISEAPRLPTDKLFRFLWLNRHLVEKTRPEKERKEAKVKASSMDRDDLRHLTLNDYLCPIVWHHFPHDWNGFLAEARAWNESTARERIGKERLDDEGVMKMVLAVWHDCERASLSGCRAVVVCSEGRETR